MDAASFIRSITTQILSISSQYSCFIIAILTSCTTHAREAALFELNESRLLSAKPTEVQPRSERNDTPDQGKIRGAWFYRYSMISGLLPPLVNLPPEAEQILKSTLDFCAPLWIRRQSPALRVDIDTVTGKLVLLNSSRDGTKVRSQSRRCKKQKRRDRVALLSGDVIRAGPVRLKIYISAKDKAIGGLFKYQSNIWRAALPNLSMSTRGTKQCRISWPKPTLRSSLLALTSSAEAVSGAFGKHLIYPEKYTLSKYFTTAVSSGSATLRGILVLFLHSVM